MKQNLCAYLATVFRGPIGIGLDDVKKLPAMAAGVDASMATKLEATETHPKICKLCAMGKQSRQLLRIPRAGASKIGEIIHTDIAGGGKLPQIFDGARYVITLIDDYSNFMAIYLLKRKFEAEKALKDFISFIKNRNTPVLKLRSEYSSSQTQELLKNVGIVWDPTAPHNLTKMALPDETSERYLKG